jgi:acetyl esterase/lipase
MRLPGLFIAGALTAVFAVEAGLAQLVAPAVPAVGDIAAPAEPHAIPLRPPIIMAAPEQWEQRSPDNRGIRNVVNPTLTPVLPDPAKATGAAVIVAPGGGFRFISIDSEGYKVARWLAERGIAAFVLKYRTVPVPRDRSEYSRSVSQFMASLPKDDNKLLDPTREAVEDAQAAVRLVRSRAAEWKIEPAKVGFMGFSAGGLTALGVGLAADKEARPNFIAPIYPPMMSRAVPNDAPPMFLAIALDDPLFAKGKPLGLIQSWRDAGRPMEVHLYEKGGHGWSFNPAFNASALYLAEFLAWMKDRKIIAPK